MWQYFNKSYFQNLKSRLSISTFRLKSLKRQKKVVTNQNPCWLINMINYINFQRTVPAALRSGPAILMGSAFLCRGSVTKTLIAVMSQTRKFAVSTLWKITFYAIFPICEKVRFAPFSWLCFSSFLKFWSLLEPFALGSQSTISTESSWNALGCH